MRYNNKIAIIQGFLNANQKLLDDEVFLIKASAIATEMPAKIIAAN